MLVNEDPKTTAKKNLKIIHMNTHSLLCHLDEVQSFVLSHRPDILAVSEMWLDPSVSDCEVSLSGYHLYRCDRSRSGGGIGVYVADHEYLSCSTLSHSSGVSNHGVLSTCGFQLAFKWLFCSRLLLSSTKHTSQFC